MNLIEKFFGRADKRPTFINTLVFDKSQFNEQRAREWIAKNNMSASGAPYDTPTRNELQFPIDGATQFGNLKEVQVAPGVNAYVGRAELVEKAHSGIMVAIYIPADVARLIAVDGGEKPEDMHLTLAYVPGVGDDPEFFEAMCQAVKEVADVWAPVAGVVGGVGRFNASLQSDWKGVYYASVDAPGLTALREVVVDQLRDRDINISDKHGFTPHVTLKYIDKDAPIPADIKASDAFRMPTITVASKDKRMDYTMSGSRVAKAQLGQVHVNQPIGEESPKADKFPGTDIDNLEVEILRKYGCDNGWLDPDDVLKLAGIMKAIDWEVQESTNDVGVAQVKVMAKMAIDPNFYQGVLGDKMAGVDVDIDPGAERAPFRLGVGDHGGCHAGLYYDVHLGLPFADATIRSVRVGKMADVDVNDVIGEIERVLQPGGRFDYEGDIRLRYTPVQLVQLSKSKDKQEFMKVVYPDAATADDAEPGTPQGYDELPTDQALAATALDHYMSNPLDSEEGNLAAGYESQGAGGVDKDKEHDDNNMAELMESLGDFAAHFQNFLDEEKTEKTTRPVKRSPVRTSKKESGVEKILKSKPELPIFKADSEKQVVYCVVLAPNEIDLQEDYMYPEDIEKAAHDYLMRSRVIGASHKRGIDATPVESYIAPQDLVYEGGPYGSQEVKKGSWVIGIKVHDPVEWEKVKSGEYTGVSVGGLGVRD